MKKLVVFDLDGTLLDTLDDLAVSCNFALKQCDMATYPVAQYRYFVGNGIKKLIERVAPADTTPDAMERLYAEFIRYYDAHAHDKTRPYPGIMEMLTQIRLYDVKTGILSNKADHFVQQIVSNYFPAYFDYVQGQREGIPIKPDPFALTQMIARFGIPTQQVCYVGDSDVDMQTGRRAGVYTVGVSWGFRTKQELKNAGAIAIINKPMELIKIMIDI